MSGRNAGRLAPWTILALAAGTCFIACGRTSEASESKLLENRNLIEARYEAVNAHDWERFQRFYADSISWNDPGLAAPIKGPEVVRQRLETWTAAFPDLKWTLEELFTQGDLVCAEFTFQGTHEGELVGPDGVTLTPTNRRIELGAVGVYLIQDNKIAESRIYFDFGKLRSTGR